MSSSKSATRESDFSRLLSYLQTKGALEAEASKEKLASVRSMHHDAFVIALWDDSLSRSPPRSRVFLSEMRSDSIQTIPLGLMGYVRPATLLLRCILENTLRHVYYHQHQTEFEQLVRDPGEYVSFHELVRYIPKTRPFHENRRVTEQLTASCSRLYAELSLDVHAHPLGHMQRKKSLSEIRPKANQLGELSKKMQQVCRVSNLALCVYYGGRMTRLDPVSMSVVRRHLTPTQRKLL